MASKQGHNQPGGGGGGGGRDRAPLQWISQALREFMIENLSSEIRHNAEQYYLSMVEMQSKARTSINKGKARTRAKGHLNDLKNNNIYDADTGRATGQSGEGGQADVLMMDAIKAVRHPKRKKKRHPGGGRRRRTRRRTRRRRTRRKTRRRTRRRKRRHRHSKKCRHKKRCRRTTQRGGNKFRAFARSLTPAPLLDVVDGVQNDMSNLYTGLVGEKPFVSPSVMVQPSNKAYKIIGSDPINMSSAYSQAKAKV